MSRKKNIYKSSEIRFVRNGLSRQSRMQRNTSSPRSPSSVRRKEKLRNGLVGWIHSMLNKARKRTPIALLQKGNIHSLIRYALRMRKMQ